MKHTIEDFIGNTPLVRLQRLPGFGQERHPGKLEGNNPAGSVKDRPAISMIRRAEERGEIKPGDTLIEATSGNTGIALAMAAAIRGYRMVLVMPEHLSVERARRCARSAPRSSSRRRRAAWRTRATSPSRWSARARARSSTSSPTPTTRACTTRPPAPRSGATPRAGSRTSSRAWAPPAPSWAARASSRRRTRDPDRRLPAGGGLADPGHPQVAARRTCRRSTTAPASTALEYVSQADAEEMTRRLAREEGIFAGISSGGAVRVALRVAQGGQERGDRLRRLRPRRPLSLDRRLS